MLTAYSSSRAGSGICQFQEPGLAVSNIRLILVPIFQVYHSTGNAAKLAEYTRILQEWNFLRDTKDNEQVGKDFVTSCLMFEFVFKFSM
jgi:hypothetical protein